TRDTTEEEQAGYWRRVQRRMDDVGPIPQCIFDDDEYETRVRGANNVLVRIDASNAVHYKTAGGMGMWPSNDASHKLVKAVRLITQSGFEAFVNLPACFSLGNKLIARLFEVDGENDVIYRLLTNR
ncbi:retrotransposon hot spot (RHS) protein, partial [Trypanosoma rangeli]